MIPALALTLCAALMLSILPDRKTGRDGLYLCILWLSQAVFLASKALFAIAEGYWSVLRRMRRSGRLFMASTARAWKEAEVER
jgi:small-conductance mechanosensitive channel